ncbi:MaoC family dehydratase [Variovorax sp. LG9.2]|uniref:MaoC family dehydratase n=1 Tax=Variovorax sp. LG9.2 TaxID=3048626 RepID=UPI002B23DB93|nr:MaoC family dehydratase [Variovorax sp. LG9.2]MEB0056608.1 MaoC family dehydratase [Variovorax sp. LG9.2]
MNGRPALKVGDAKSFRKTLTVAEQAMFTGISGNMAPLYVDKRAAEAAGFDNMLAFELSAIALATTALNRVAGVAWRLGGLQIDFAMPVLVGETVESRIEVLDVADDAVSCSVRCTKSTGEVMAQGTARLVPVQARG